MNYEYQYIITLEAIADTPEQAKQKAKDFRTDILNKYCESPDTMVTSITKYKRNKAAAEGGGHNLRAAIAW